MTIKTRAVTLVESQDWDALVKETYGREYCFQQQDNCRDRGSYHFLTVPDVEEAEEADEYMADSVPEEVGSVEEMGVKFSPWLARDPKYSLIAQEYEFQLRMWWQRNFYPDVNMVANDLHAKGLLPAGDYIIAVEW